jgi:hypothetical protein
MARKWTVAEKNVVEVDPRHFKMMSAQAIRSVLDALVELITNSDDAYRNLDDERGKIIIEVTRRRGEKSGDILVKDRAGGMTLKEMKEKILKYGGFSAMEESRGFMGRGAKDVVALGNVTFESIKNGKLSCVKITTEFDTEIMKPITAGEKDYKEFSLKPERGGTIVKLEVGKKHKVPQHETLCRDLQRHYALRDILRRRDILLRDAKSGQEILVPYTPPAGELIVDQVLNFAPPYEEAEAELKIFKAPVELGSELNEGIIVCDEHAVHQSTRFSPDLDQDPIGRRFFGRLDCKYIRKLQLEFEQFRKRGKQPPDYNPVDIVDPNRRRGLDRENHPFVKVLFKWAEEALQQLVDQVKEQEREPTGKVANEETDKRLRNLSKAVAQHLKERLEEESLMPRTPEQEAVLNKEGVLLNPQFQRITLGETKRMGYTVISFGEAEDPGHVTIELEGEGLKVTPLNPPLKPQRRNPERLTAYFDVKGVAPTENVTFTIRHKHELIAPVSRTLEVVEPIGPYADRPDGVFFENQHYTVHDNGTRTLTVIGKGKRFRSVDWASRNLLETTDPESIVIMRGRALKVEKIANDLWRGEVQIRGRGIGKRGRITLTIPIEDGIESTIASVEVVDKEPPPEVSIKIKVVPESMGLWRAAWDRNNPNLLKVYAKHPTLERYLGSEEDGYPGQKGAHFQILLAEIVAGKVVERILEQRMEANPTDFEEPKAYFFYQSEEMTSFLPTAHKIMISDGEAKMLIG